MAAYTWQPGQNVLIPYQQNPPSSVAGMKLEIHVCKTGQQRGGPVWVLTIGNGIDNLDVTTGNFNAVFSALATKTIGAGSLTLELWNMSDGQETLMQPTVCVCASYPSLNCC
jgi:hypothetical protein